ncbi:MAG: polysaccharide biosynthesis/export family protein [Muribaculaceae bacterium]|nr:polysaccharide biosynthesis/export family protein [Muribaculaceae bacterium]
MKTLNNPLMLALTVLLLASCGSTKDVPYLIDANSLPKEVLQAASRATDPVIMPGDLLQITVTGRNAESVQPFNKISYISGLTSNGNALNQGGAGGGGPMYYYLVDDNGNIEFPMLGQLHIGGMTKAAVEESIASQIYPKYLTEKPGVEARIQNFTVSILGEVKSPGTVNAQNGRLNILEAIARAGDLSIKGRRDNIMLIRTNADGSRSVNTINLNDKNLLVSPLYNLQQNDVIYVEPNASAARSSWSIPPGLSLGMSSVGTLISIATFIITLTKL